MGEVQESKQNLQTKNSSTTGNIITSPDEIAHTFANHYANISKHLHNKSKLGKNRNKKREELPYNKPFADIELKAVLGEDTIHPQILKYLFVMYNKIWEKRESSKT